MMMREGALTKNDLCWVLVKLMGVVLVYHSLAAVAAVAAAWTAWLGIGDNLEELSDENRKKVLWPVKAFLLAGLVQGGVGLRLLVSGSLLHGLLMAVPLGSPEEAGAPKSKTQKPKRRSYGSLAEKRLSEDEFVVFQAWLEDHPEMKRRADIDQLALFRDAQKAGEI